MKKYIIAGTMGFLVHAAWMISGAYTYAEFDADSFLNVLKFYYTAGEGLPDAVIFLYPLLFAVLFAGVVRLIIARMEYSKSEKRWISLAAGIGFYLAFVAIFIVLYQMVSGFGF